MAGENTKTSQLTGLPNDAFTALFRMAFAGGDYNLSITALKAMLLSSDIQVPTEIAANSNEDINLGASATYDAIYLDYFLERGARKRSGRLIITHDGSSADYAEIGLVIIGQDILSETPLAGVTFSVNINTGQIVLNVDCDNSDILTSSFKYKISTL